MISSFLLPWHELGQFSMKGGKMNELTKLSEYGFVEVVNILFLTVTLIVITVRATEKAIKWGHSKLMYFYNKKRGKEKKEESLADCIRKINELSVQINDIEEKRRDNIRMFLDHENGVIEKMREFSAEVRQTQENQKNNVKKFTDHEIGVLEKLNELTEGMNEISSLVRELKQKEEENEEKEDVRRENEIILIESVNAAIALGEATARAVQRIPDAKCNGDMHAALDYATGIKHKHKEFITKQGIESMY